MKWEVHVGGAEPTDKVFFECLDGMFGCIGPMVFGFNELYLPTSYLHEGFDGSHCLVICDQKCGGVSKGVKMVVDKLKSQDNVMVGGGLDWHSKDVVGIVGIGDKE